MMRPNFLLIGAMKCGTSSLAGQLATHPEVFMSSPKELHFFSLEENWQRGLRWYESQFTKAGAAAAIGEASTTYTMHPLMTGVPERIAETLPDARFLYIVRHPVERILSNYTHDWLLGEDNPWCQGDPNRSLEEVWETHPQFLPCSRYHYQIEQYLRFFKPEQFLVLAFEEFAADPAVIHRKIYTFLGVDSSFVPADLSPRNISAKRVREANWVWALRRVPLLKPIAKTLLPDGLRRRLQRIGGQPKPKDTVSQALREKIASVLDEDVAALCDFTHCDFRKIWNLPAR